jgi:hypothetical protein
VHQKATVVLSDLDDHDWGVAKGKHTMSNVYRNLGSASLDSSVNFQIVAACDDESFSWDSDGVMFEAHSWVEARYAQADVDLFGDAAVLAAVKDVFAKKGLSGDVSWGDEGLSDTGVAVLDMDMKLVEQIWPAFKLVLARVPGMG